LRSIDATRSIIDELESPFDTTRSTIDNRREPATQRFTFGPHGPETHNGLGRSGSGSSGSWSSGGSGSGSESGSKNSGGNSRNSRNWVKKLHGPALEALLEGAEYDAETEDAAEASEAAATARVRPPKPADWGTIARCRRKFWKNL